MFNWISQKFIRDFGIDLGTVNSLVYLKGRGLVVNEPTVVAINNKTRQLLAIGNEAKKMLGRTPAHVEIIRPIVNGVVSDFEMVQELVRNFLKRLAGRPISYYRKAVVGIPGSLTEVERKSIEDAIVGTGISRVFLLNSSLLAVIGARLPVSEPAANLIVDIGGGTTEIAVISMNGVVTSRSLKIAGERFNADIIDYVRDEFRLDIGEATAEEVKVAAGSAIPIDGRLETSIRGRDLSTGLPREVVIKNNQARLAIARSLQIIVENIKNVIEETPPELVGDVLKRGIYLCGGGSLLRGIDQVIEKELSINATVVDDPLTCVVRGAGVVVENLENYRGLFINQVGLSDVKV